MAYPPTVVEACMADETTFDRTTKTGLARAEKIAAFVGPLALILSHHAALAIDTMEAIGAEKCGGRVKSYEIEFLAPDSAPLEATAKAIVRGASDPAPDAVTLSLDGKPCTNARCGFTAKKGETYKFAAASRLPRIDDLCIVVARP